MSIADNRIALIVEAAATAVTNDDGYFDQKPLVDEIRIRLKTEALTPDIKQQIEYDQAAYYATRFVNGRKPKLRGDGGLFHPVFILPLGNGKRVWMDRATNSDLMTWGALDTANIAKALDASARRQKYVALRLAVFAKHPKWTLGEVERESFGYIETEEPPDDTDDDPETTAP